MRNLSATPVTASTAPSPDSSRRHAAVELVCAALVLALVTLAGRIASFW
jgi:hypothetical protein